MKQIFLISWCIFCLVGCDFSTKKLAYLELRGSHIKSLMSGKIKLIYTENSGGMLGFGSDMPDHMKLIIFKVCVGFLLLSIFFFAIRNKNMNKWQMTSLILILSGGFGNLIDRFLNDGKVIDFMVLEIFNYRTGIFNFADLYITIGVFLLIISSKVIKDNFLRIIAFPTIHSKRESR